MTRDLAEGIMSTCLSLSNPLNSIANLIERIDDKPERDKLKKALGDLVLGMYANIQVPIIKQYPDLDPDRTSSA